MFLLFTLCVVAVISFVYAFIIILLLLLFFCCLYCRDVNVVAVFVVVVASSVVVIMTTCMYCCLCLDMTFIISKCRLFTFSERSLDRRGISPAWIDRKAAGGDSGHLTLFQTSRGRGKYINCVQISH